jgi:Cof subfamily protein (haloacid dehalogenase superfamily)
VSVRHLRRLSRPSRLPGPSRLPSLIATDLDGTLLGRGYSISARTAKVLAQASAAGTVVVLATGRPLRWMPMVYEQLAAGYPTICANGAVSYDPVTDTVHESRPLSPEVVAEVCTRLAAAVPGISFAVEIEGGRRMLHEPAYPVAWESTESGAREAPLSELITHHAVKLLARSAEHDADTFTALVNATLAGEVEATHSSFTGLVEISASGVDKGTGLAALAQRLGIMAADVLAFGDMPNDVPMLRWAGRSVAVANAHPAARAVADEHTLSNVDDGVAVYLERLLS